MITITRSEIDIEISDEEVIQIVRDSVLKYFDIGMSILKDRTRDSSSSYPRRLYWYLLKYQYGLKNNQIMMIDDVEYDSSAVTIQSEIVLLQQHYNKKLRSDLEELRKIMTIKENWFHEHKLTQA